MRDEPQTAAAMKSTHSPGVGWMGVRRGHKARPLEWIVEKLILLTALSAILMILLIFFFVTREAWPVFTGNVNSAAAVEQMTMEEMQKLSPAQLQKYLELSDEEFRGMDQETIKLLMEVKLEAMAEAKAHSENPDAKINTASWRYLLQPYQWQGYEKPEHIWQPVGNIHKYNIIPLLIGSLKVSFIALAASVPMALAAAIYISQLAPGRVREVVKPMIELMAGIPSVVLGFFALIVMAGFLQKIFGYPTRLNALLAGLALSLAVIPIIFSIAEDALTSVPRSYTQGALALGASKWQAAWQIVLPAALPGVFAAVVLGFGRAIGETMIVLMTSTASVMSWSIFESARPITATIAAEMAETVFGGHHYRVLFMLGALLFAFTFLLNLIGDLIIHRLKGRLEGKA
ncbi:MAG TPA: phosphate ABC transporter permease subunit PstC [Methylomirabilota bacterium]|nr:phosphate ABC transporter permease subunit PstC [Methylomirabilota bacterium]